MTRLHPQRRCGAVYVLVLTASMLVTVIGVSAVLAVRVERRAADGLSDLAQARFLAQSAVELGFLTIHVQPAWRTTEPNGVWITSQSLGRGTLSLEGIDPDDGDLTDSPTDPLLLTGFGYSGEALYKLQVRLEPGGSTPLSCLEVALHAGVDLEFDSATVGCDQIMSANNNATVTGSIVTSNVEVVNTWSGLFFTPLPTKGMTPRIMPEADDDFGTVFDYYLTNGTVIGYAFIPNAQGKKTIQEVVIGPESNPYGALTNSEGIYLIDCVGGTLRIRNARLLATLLITNCAGFSVEQSVNWEPGAANLPVLLVSGPATLATNATALSESSLGVNFNPAGAPYGGVTDGDQADTYPSEINGLVYTSTTLATSGTVTVNGIVVVGTTLNTTDTMNLTYDASIYANPPPGFGVPGGGIRVVSGSWRRIVN